jgi:pyruvate/2-oxoglutarate dehydrogenase complex dihydrolipoamide acyltransferase (E2) component
MGADVVYITAEQLNANDDSISVVEVLFEYGAFVRQGDHLLTVETSKAAAEIRSPIDGYVTLSCPVGTLIDVGENIATIYSAREAVPAIRPPLSPEPSSSKGKRTNSPDTPRATRKAIELARELGVDIADIAKEGFIREEDVRRHAAQAADAAVRTRIDLSRVRKAAVRTLEVSRSTIVPAYLLAEFQYPSFSDKKVDVFDLVIYRAARLIKTAYPDCNAYFDGDAIVRYSQMNIGFTVDVDGELFMPVIRDADSLSLDEIAAARAESILSLYRGERSQDILSEPTVCATGLNGRHITFQIPVVFPTTSLIIGINQMAATDATATSIYLTLAYDHRALSGLLVSRFADELVDAVLERP